MNVMSSFKQNIINRTIINVSAHFSIHLGLVNGSISKNNLSIMSSWHDLWWPYLDKFKIGIKYVSISIYSIFYAYTFLPVAFRNINQKPFIFDNQFYWGHSEILNLIISAVV